MFLKLLKEPLIQFFLSGFVLYAFYVSLYEPQQAAPQTLKKVLRVPPLYKQQEALFDKNSSRELSIYTTVLLHESYFLKLYMQDKQISTILINKMEALLANTTKMKEPTQQELRQFYMQHKIEYGKIKSLSFILLKTKPIASQEAKQLQNRMNLLELKPTTTRSYTLTKEQITQHFGVYFTHKVTRLFSKRWSMPIRAKDGLYFVYVTQKDTTQAYSFDEVEDGVYKDYKYSQFLHQTRKQYEKILQHYTIAL